MNNKHIVKVGWDLDAARALREDRPLTKEENENTISGIVKYTFNTASEAHAFMKGISLCEGWLDPAYLYIPPRTTHDQATKNTNTQG